MIESAADVRMPGFPSNSPLGCLSEFFSWYAGKNTGGVSKILYQWRKKKGLLASSIVSGKLTSTTEAKDAFHIGVDFPYSELHLGRLDLYPGFVASAN